MAIYNDFRPHKFGEIMGQSQVTAVLLRQAQTNYFHHAYLFYGASGTGKTTTARVMASVLNCEDVVDGEPCGQCKSCKAIVQSKSWDVMELDGARFRGIDDMKDLVYKASFSPIGRTKVYIIDECHQLTEPAWNGLLKLLEEPPPQLVVMLCTTRFDKVPDTVASRCQLYPFRKLELSDVVGKLGRICESVGIEIDDKHAEFIARTSAGNMRSAENMLEQCVAVAV